MSEKYIEEMIQTRRALHKRPELGWTEFETMWHICSHLEQWGIPYVLGTKVINPAFVMGRNETEVKDAMERAKKHGVPEAFLEKTEGYTGAAAIIDTGRPGPVTAFRCDMDALPIRESDDCSHEPAKLGFASERAGIMHACGHDGHSAVGLTVAHWLWDHKDELCGQFKVLFQPAEEGVRGARPMSESGIVDDVDWLVGSHVGGNFHSGEVTVQDGGFLASTKFDITFTGLQSHAGNAPHKGHNALVAAACATMMIQGIPRHGDGDSRVAVGKLVAGEGRNITPAHAHMECEVRGSTHEANEFMFSRAQEVVKGAADMLGVKYDLIKTGQATTLVTTPEAMETMRKAAEAVPGVTVEDIHHCGGSEDCTLFMRRVAEHGGNPGFFLFGCENKGHHRPDFDIQDTVNLKPGFEVFTNIATAVCGRKD